MSAGTHRTRHGRPTARFVRPDGRTPARHADAPRAEFAPLSETPRHAILSTFFGKADGKSNTRTANPKNNLRLVHPVYPSRVCLTRLRKAFYMKSDT